MICYEEKSVKIKIFLAFFIFSACFLGGIMPARAQEREIKFAITSAVGSDPGFVHYRELTKYIADKVGGKSVLITGLTYAQVDNLFLKGQVDVGFLCNAHYIRREKEAGFELLAAPIVTDYEKAKFQIYIIAHKESDMTSIDDLKGKRVDFSDPLSTTTIYGAHLLAQKGETLKSYFNKAIYSGSHDMTVELVANRLVDAGFIDGHIWDYHNKKQPEYSSQTKIIHKSPDFTIPPVVVPKTLDKATKAKIKEVLLTMHEDAAGKEILKKLRIDKFVDIDNTAYRFLYQMYNDMKDRI